MSQTPEPEPVKLITAPCPSSSTAAAPSPSPSSSSSTPTKPSSPPTATTPTSGSSPANPYDRATARFWADFIATKCLKPLWLSMWTADGDEQARLAAETKASLAVLDAELGGRGTRFFGGDELGFVDLAACTLAHWLGVLEEVAGVRLAAEGEFPALRRWAEAYTSHKVVRRSLPNRDQLVDFFAANKERYRSMVNAAAQ